MLGGSFCSLMFFNQDSELNMSGIKKSLNVGSWKNLFIQKYLNIQDIHKEINYAYESRIAHLKLEVKNPL